jgi:tetratricopeptide (TPR) repeat protein
MDKALAINPHQIGAYFNKAFALYFLGNHGASIYNYNKVLEITPNAKDALYGKKFAVEALFATAKWR